ncbi:hypothetical protein [Chryseosolibacter indicus]|uniref:Uncharacterized protein n=1 Tax=Chryseosolibacter indicus TaxID=2782351 RepID=A0ABS5VXD6_9BACT|nr:hypothetical protein [Chryseosolibacter indicus]MBT1706068.1 hypothetical protein [Chryseosolibacter indicus]
MNKFFYYALSLFTVLLLQCTTEEVVVPANQKVQFSVSVSSSDPGGRVSQALPEGASVKISITNNAGPVLTNEQINLLKVGDGYITEPFELKAGAYAVSDFMIVKGTEVLYATPKQGSPLASSVSNPLPFSFVVTANGVSNIGMQVISVNAKAPEDFGYVSFGVDIVQPLQIAVFAPGNGSTKLIAGRAEIVDGSKIVQTVALEAKINTISFAGDADRTYTLNVYDVDGNKIFTRTFTYNSLIEELDGAPLKVMATPVLRFKFVDHGTSETPLRFTLEGEGEVVIEGPAEFAGRRQLPLHFTDVVLTEGYHEVTITGDIDKITTIESFSYNGGIETVEGLQYVTSLQRFSPGGYFNDDLDLSYNTQLSDLDLFWVRLPNWFTLPENHQIRSFSLEAFGNPDAHLITREEFDIIVNNIHHNAIEKNITGGRFYASPIEEISTSAHNKLIELRDTYGWNIDMDGYYL